MLHFRRLRMGRSGCGGGGQNKMMVIIAPSSVDQQYNNYINDVNKCSLRSNFLNFIHQGYIQVQGNPIESTQAYIKIGKHLHNCK
jgi:hypothetical protein